MVEKKDLLEPATGSLLSIEQGVISEGLANCVCALSAYARVAQTRRANIRDIDGTLVMIDIYLCASRQTQETRDGCQALQADLAYLLGVRPLLVVQMDEDIWRVLSVSPDSHAPSLPAFSLSGYGYPELLTFRGV
jgi:hypothetical protein